MPQVLTVIAMTSSLILMIGILDQYRISFLNTAIDQQKIWQKDWHISISRDILQYYVNARNCKKAQNQFQYESLTTIMHRDPVSLALMARLYAICGMKKDANLLQIRSQDISGQHFLSALLRLENRLRATAVFQDYRGQNDEMIISTGIQRDGRLRMMFTNVEKRCPLCRRKFRQLKHLGNTSDRREPSTPITNLWKTFQVA